MDLPEAARNIDIIIAAEKDLYLDCERKDWSPYKLAKPLAILWLVTQMSGKVGNGGLQYFFEADWPQKPPYSLFVGALKHIGAIEASEVLARAAALFPFPEPHLDVVKRNQFMDACRTRDGDDNNQFWLLAKQLMDLEEEINAKLVIYIQKNLDVFPNAKTLISS